MEARLKQIVMYDCFMGATFILMTIARILSLTYFSAIANETKADIETVKQVYEMNPVAKMIFSLDRIGTVLQVMLIPAMTLAIYFYYRRKTLQGKMDLDILGFFVNFTFFIVFFNIVNDLSALIGRWL
jgi:hypothetical protein